MIKTTLQRGFTLIELLVVIAIIGILAAVVIGSLNDARSTGLDASIKQTMANVRQQAEIVYNADNFTYDSVCTTARVTDLFEAAGSVVNANNTVAIGGPATNNATTPASRAVGCIDNDTQWAASAPLTANNYGDFWCVDSTGTSKQTTSGELTGAVCP